MSRLFEERPQNVPPQGTELSNLLVHEPDAIAHLQDDLKQLQTEISRTLKEIEFLHANGSTASVANPGLERDSSHRRSRAHLLQSWIAQLNQALSPRLRAVLLQTPHDALPSVTNNIGPAYRQTQHLRSYSHKVKRGARANDRQHSSSSTWAKTVAGLGLTVGIALLAIALRQLPGFSLFSPLILAVLLGILVKNTVGTPTVCQPGVTFSLKRILRLAIILLGLRLSLGQLVQVGPVGLLIVTATLGATFVFTCWLGRQLGISQKLTHLIAAGTSICGASAVVATNTVVEGRDEDVAYAVTVVTVFGTVSMLLYPVVAGLLQLSPEVFGIWSGASIHEVAQVVAAAFQGGEVSGELATISKLSRVLFLVPIMLVLSAAAGEWRRSAPGSSRPFQLNQLPIPWFVFGFMVLIGLNSLNIFPTALKDWLIQSNKFLLAIALAAMGLETNLLKMKQTGLKPLYLGAASWIFISVFSLTLIKILY